MANHARVIPPKGKMPTIEQIDTDVRGIIAEKFPEFTLNLQDKSWLMIYENDGYLGLKFWLDEYDGKPCIEFRHGHSYEWLWWIEYEIREQLARKYKAQVVDDCNGKYCKPQQKTYNTYLEYITDKSTKTSVDLKQIIRYCRQEAPKALKYLIGSTKRRK